MRLFVTTALFTLGQCDELLGACKDDFDQCQQITVTTTACYEREDVDVNVSNQQLRDDYEALELFKGELGFIDSNLAVDSVTNGAVGASPNVEYTDSKGVEGVDDQWFRLEFANNVVEKTVICGTFTSIFDEEPGQATKTADAWTEHVNSALTESLQQFVASDTSVSGVLITEATTTEATTTEAPEEGDWEAICAQPQNQLVDTLNLDTGGWGTSKILFSSADSYVVRVNVKQRPGDLPYTGAFMFARRYCGPDFMEKFIDGTIQIDVQDKVSSAENFYTFYKEDKKSSAFVVQYSNTGAEGNVGTAKRDTVYMTLSGLRNVVWNNKDLQECIQKRMVVVNMDYTTEDQTPCLAYQRTVGNYGKMY